MVGTDRERKVRGERAEKERICKNKINKVTVPEGGCEKDMVN
jgi:hypothetical protein